MLHTTGCITIGQSPRDDVIPKMENIPENNIKIEEGH